MKPLLLVIVAVILVFSVYTLITLDYNQRDISAFVYACFFGGISLGIFLSMYLKKRKQGKQQKTE